MKKSIFLLLSAVLAACGQTPKNKTAGSEIPADGVEVMTFHAKKRCATCIAMERLTREVVETEFAAQLADSSLTMRVVDIARQEALADKYEVSWSSLLLVRHKDGAEAVTDLTPLAFANARTNPERFKTELKARIEELLKQ